MRGERIDLRVTLEEKLRWMDFARANDLRLGEWIRLRVNADLPSPEQIAKNEAAAREFDAQHPIGSTITIKMPPRYKARYFDVP